MSKSNWQQLSQEREGCSLLSQKQSERLLAVNHQQGLAILAVFLYTDEKKTYSCEIMQPNCLAKQFKCKLYNCVHDNRMLASGNYN